MAAKIKQVKGIDVVIAKGARGAFEVTRDGAVVFSKLQTGRFPDSEQEVIDLL